jgi:chemotaxis protein CheX
MTTFADVFEDSELRLKPQSMTTPKVADKTTEKTTDQADPITPRSEWIKVLRQSTIEVFSTMVGVAVAAPENASPGDPPQAPVVAHVTGMIGIAGAVRALLSLGCSDHATVRIASQMLGIPAEEAAAQKSDAIGEVCNMIAGQFKHTIGHGFSCTLTVPTVVIGGNYTIHCLEKGERIEFPVLYEGETMLITLDIRG